jgi:hypothetical protein
VLKQREFLVGQLDRVRTPARGMVQSIQFEICNPQLEPSFALAPQQGPAARA